MNYFEESKTQCDSLSLRRPTAARSKPRLRTNPYIVRVHCLGGTLDRAGLIFEKESRGITRSTHLRASGTFRERFVKVMYETFVKKMSRSHHRDLYSRCRSHGASVFVDAVFRRGLAAASEEVAWACGCFRARGYRATRATTLITTSTTLHHHALICPRGHCRQHQEHTYIPHRHPRPTDT